MSESAAVRADLPSWGNAEEAELDRLVGLASGLCEGARQGVVSLQEKMRGTASFAAVVLSIEIGAWSGFSAAIGNHPLSAAGLRMGMTLLVLAVAVASFGYRPLDAPGLGSLVEWRGVLIVEGATRMKARLIESLEGVHGGHWQPLMKRQARLAAWAQSLLASGLAVSAAAVMAL